MKATTFEPESDLAEALIAPDAVLLTVGALVNRILDRADNPQFLIIDQGNNKLISIDEDVASDAIVTAATSRADLLGDIAATAHASLVQFSPGTVSPVPFEGA